MENKPKTFDVAQVITGNKPKVIIITVIVTIILAGVVGFWFWKHGEVEISNTSETSTEYVPKVVEPKELQENVGGGLGASIYEKSQNPIADKLSETNPFGKTPINPLKSIYTNPFE